MELIGYSYLFDEVEDNQEIPEYEIDIRTAYDGRVHFVEPRRKREYKDGGF
jgi:hypothetical protein